jgi:integrase/recombinase XerD
MHVSDAIELYLCDITHLSEQYQIWMRRRLSQFDTWCVENNLILDQVKVPEIRKYIEYLSTRANQAKGRTGILSSHTVHGHARAIHTFLVWCSVDDDLEQYVSEKTPAKMRMPRMDEKVIETFSEAQIKALFDACDRNKFPDLAVRDRAILSVLLDTGVRADELCTLTLTNLHLNKDDQYIKVMGKGRKEREISFGQKTRRALTRYLIIRRRADTRNNKTLFLSRTGQAFVVGGLEQLIYRLARWADVEGARCHRFRHTFAVSFLKNGGDVYKLSRLMGHSSVSITETYLRTLKAREARHGGNSVLDSL